MGLPNQNSKTSFKCLHRSITFGDTKVDAGSYRVAVKNKSQKMRMATDGDSG